MLKFVRSAAAAALSLVLVLGLSACADIDGNGDAKVLKMALEIAPNALTTQMAQQAADQIKEETNGSVVVEIYPSGQLGSQRDFIESMILGTIEIGYVSASSVENFEPEFVLYDIPFTVFGPEHAETLWNSDISLEVQQRFLEEQGIRTLGMIDCGPRNIYTTEEVHSSGDFSKLTMRVADVAGLINLFDALGANPTVTSFNEIYTAMQTGVVNGFEIGLESVLSNNLQEVVDYCVETCHTYTIDCFLMSEKAYQRLTPEEQEIVTRAFAQASADQRRMFNENLVGYKEELAAAGVETIQLSDEEMDKLNEMAQPAIEKSISGIFDPSIVDEIRAMG
ncbi:TRAP transporter substrate-binding protein [Pseudoflavonifractor sp. AF19-9AC]|uniref:TRAP transporter substrate-binding protein n=1 Tax=Pseudoflavonifractor sp. AF19-9AC TaxID=2292244 RepID=UPI0013145BC9|nr:TRAP transporter substrate-binding protein [Pseudoflavonifractor sp. AF19-9AC]